MSDENLHHGTAMRWLSVSTVWMLAVAGAIAVGLLSSPREYFTWLPLTLVACVLATFLIQLALQSKEGFVLRVSASVGGAVLALAIATVILAPSALAG